MPGWQLRASAASIEHRHSVGRYRTEPAPRTKSRAARKWGIVPRIELITEKSEIGEDQYAEFDHIVEVLHRVGGPFGILMHSPGLAEKVMSAGAQVRLGSTLSPVEREIAVISTSRRKTPPTSGART